MWAWEQGRTPWALQIGTSGAATLCMLGMHGTAWAAWRAVRLSMVNKLLSTMWLLAGLPVQVARRMMQQGKALVGSMVTDAAQASRAAADGANLVLLQVPK